jgi:hypothetical protein
MPDAKATRRMNLTAMVWAISTTGPTTSNASEGAGELAATREGTVWTRVGTEAGG